MLIKYEEFDNTQAVFSLNVDKYSFLKQRVQFLSFEVCGGEIKPNLVQAKFSPNYILYQKSQFFGIL